ncbi:MAG: hypothetical protein WCD31_09575 [Gillisia sp.]
MKKITFGISVLVLVIGVSGCSRKKNTFINRNYHAVTAEYNTLYNGEVALQEGKQQIDASYFEDFWNILPVERMAVSHDIALPGTTKNESFKTAEEKATKAIQKHSMQIGGQEKNPQMDEAYLLLGKARYYDQRFIPALEAFNYILYKYPASNNINKAQIWREKTNIRLENDELAIQNLKRLLKSESLSSQDAAGANAMLAQAYINTGALDSAIVPLKKAAEITGDHEKQARYYYIEAQLYNRFNQRDSADLVFDKIIELNRKIPREFLVNAQLAQTRNFNFDTNNPSILLQKLQDLADNRENRPFLDKIFFQFAEYYNHLDSIQQAQEYYNKSLKAATNDKFLKSLSYETLGNIHFDRGEYQLASAYYDSTLTQIPANTRDYFKIMRKRDNLKEVILYEKIAEKNDSILDLVAMSDDERLSYFTRYAEGLKEKAKLAAEKRDISAQTPAPGATLTSTLPPAIGGPNPGNTFYFYNPSRVANGMQEFLRTWGKRELKDNWRTDTGAAVAAQPGELDEVSTLILENNPQFDPQTYLAQIPQDTEYIDSLSSQRNDAYYRLGLIYKEKYSKNALAKERLQSLLDYTDKERYLAPANYYLYEIYKEEGNISEAEKFKNEVLNSFPQSRYAERIKNPELAFQEANKAQKNFDSIYKLFQDGKYQAVLDSSSVYMEKYRDNALVPKFALLKAQATGRLMGLEAYKQALLDVTRDYPRSDAGKKAEELLNTAIPKMENLQFQMEAPQKNMKLLFAFSSENRAKAEALQEKINKALKDLNYNGLSTSLDVYNPKEVFVVVHGLKDENRAEGFAELLKNNKKYLVDRAPVFISAENYRIVQLYKNLDQYLKTRNNN